jgi:hypothetical protein
MFAYAWGVSVRQIKGVVRGIRESEYGFCHTSKVKSFKDNSRYFEDFSYDDVETVMRENVLLNGDLGTFDIGQY